MREDWIECKLGEISTKITDGTHHKPIYTSAGVHFISVKDIKNDVIDFTNTKFISEEDHNLLIQRCNPEEDDLLITKSGTIGRMAIVPKNCSFSLFVSVALIKNKKEYILTKYLKFYLENYLKSFSVDQIIKGGVLKNYHLEDLRLANVILISLPEQRAIVKKLESLFSSLDAGIADLKKAQQQLKIYRQAVLKKAFEGEKREQKLINISDAIGGFAFKSPDFLEKGNYQVIRIGNIRPDLIRLDSNPVFINELNDKTKKYLLKDNDIVISLTGTRNKRDYGFSALVKNENLLLNQRLAAIRFNKDCNPKYYLHYFSTDYFKDDFFSAETGNTGQGNVGMNAIKETLVPFPSLVSQNQIVKQIESRLSVCDSIEQNIKESLEKAETLRQSILKKAFEGKLLSAQELAECKKTADYEPASVLLERMKAEQNKATAKPSKKKAAQPLVVAKTEIPVAKISADIHAGLIAKVIKIHEENPASIDKLSHIKCEKIAHLVEYHLQIPLGRQPVKDAAGPDDYPHLKKIEHRAKMANYFAIQKKDIGYSYSSAKNSEKAIEKFQSALSDEKNKQLDDLITMFLKFDLEVSEIIATTYAGWNNLILNGYSNPSDEEIVYESRENWSERKLKITRERFFKAIEWMLKNEIIPTGYGAVVPFPKKKK